MQILHRKSTGDFNLLTIKFNTTQLQTTMTYWLCEENKTAWNKGFKTIHTIIKTISIEFRFNRFQLVTTTSISDPTFVLPRSSKSIVDHFFWLERPVSQVVNVTILFNNVLLHALIKFNCLFFLPSNVKFLINTEFMLDKELNIKGSESFEQVLLKLLLSIT